MPNFDYTKVDPDSLKTTADNIDESLKSMENAFKEVDKALTYLSITWHGPASKQFFAQHEQDKVAFGSHMKEISVLNSQLRDAAGIFDSADAQANELVSQLEI